MTKETNTKIEIRKEVLELISKKYNNICVGDYDPVELEIVQTELKEMAEMIRDKDKLMQLKERHKQLKNKNVSKYFNIDR